MLQRIHTTRSRFLTSALLAIALLHVSVTAQVRTKDVAEKELSFAEAVEAAKSAYEAGKFGKAMTMLQQAMQLARKAIRTKILAAMPAAPEGFERIEPKKEDDAEVNPFGALVMGAVPIEQKYRAKEGRGSLEVQTHIDSPLVKMMAIAFSTASMNPKLEVIKYGAHKGMLEEQGKDRLKLTIVLFDKHAITVDAQGISDEQLFKIFDQKFVDTIAAIVQ
ncbi:MAG: hypothetical protein H6832_06565 [Planctomycetes bacterium]|nr:hypothetical protein [Planctomycetota bacterium]MCB9918050.1 hypothetical protein [Planctomycetota bacterium]